MTRVRSLYAGGRGLRDPYVSPVFGDFSLGFPPTLLASGARDILLSDTVRITGPSRRARPAELIVLEAAPHGFFRGQAPEDRELDREVRAFIARNCPVRDEPDGPGPGGSVEVSLPVGRNPTRGTLRSPGE